MSNSKLFIRNKEYVLPRVELSLEIIDEGNKFLRFNLFADCKNLKEAGFAINCIDIEGASSTKDIETLFLN